MNDLLARIDAPRDEIQRRRDGHRTTELALRASAVQMVRMSLYHAEQVVAADLEMLALNAAAHERITTGGGEL